MKKLKYVLSIISLAVVIVALTGCGKSSAQQEVKLGVVGSDNDVWESVAKRLEKESDIKLKLVEFSDYNQPNAALNDKEIDLNAFQHKIFLNNYNKEHKTDLVSIGNTVSAPLGLYSEKIKNIQDIKSGSEISIPNDPTNESRALQLLAAAKLIKVPDTKNKLFTLQDIKENPLNLKLTELDASQTARSLKDVQAAVINSGVAVDAGLTPTKDSIFLEKVNKSTKPYVNIIVAREADKNNKTYQKIVDAYQKSETEKVIKETSKGSSIPAWKTYGKK